MGWGRKCQCQIHVSGTLGGRFSRKTTGTSDWLEAHRLADLYEKAESWTGKPTRVLPLLRKPQVDYRIACQCRHQTPDGRQ